MLGLGGPHSSRRFDSIRDGTYFDRSIRLVNMRTVQASEAKTHLLRLLDAVEQGETVVITRHGRAIARLSPEADRRQAEIDDAIANIRAIGRRNGRITVEELLSARDEGRRG